MTRSGPAYAVTSTLQPHRSIGLWNTGRGGAVTVATTGDRGIDREAPDRGLMERLAGEWSALGARRPALVRRLRWLRDHPAAVLLPWAGLMAGLLGADNPGGDAQWFRDAGLSMFGPDVFDVFSTPGLQMGPLYLLFVGMLAAAVRVVGLPVLLTVAAVQSMGIAWFALFTARRWAAQLDASPRRAQWGVVAPMVFGGLLAESIGNGHPEEVFLGLLFANAALWAQQGRLARPDQAPPLAPGRPTDQDPAARAPALLRPERCVGEQPAQEDLLGMPVTDRLRQKPPEHHGCHDTPLRATRACIELRGPSSRGEQREPGDAHRLHSGHGEQHRETDDPHGRSKHADEQQVERTHLQPRRREHVEHVRPEHGEPGVPEPLGIPARVVRTEQAGHQTRPWQQDDAGVVPQPPEAPHECRSTRSVWSTAVAPPVSTRLRPATTSYSVAASGSPRRSPAPSRPPSRRSRQSTAIVTARSAARVDQ